MTVEIKKVSKAHNGSWLGRRGTLVEYYTAHQLISKRVSIIRWEDGSSKIKVIEGDGRKVGFKVYHEEVKPTMTAEAEQAYVNDLVAKFFN